MLFCFYPYADIKYAVRQRISFLVISMYFIDSLSLIYFLGVDTETNANLLFVRVR